MNHRRDLPDDFRAGADIAGFRSLASEGRGKADVAAVQPRPFWV
jgi:hypothetical protein